MDPQANAPAADQAPDVESERRQFAFFQCAIPPAVCQKWLAAVRESDAHPSIILNEQKQPVVDLTYRNVHTIVSPYLEEMRAWTWKFLTEQAAPHLQVKIAGVDGPSLVRYSVGSFYKLHDDARDFEDGPRVLRRDYSLVVFMNTEFTGGALDFPFQDISLHPGHVGSAVIFPSNERFKHSVIPVEGGVRYTLVAWFAAEKPAA